MINVWSDGSSQPKTRTKMETEPQQPYSRTHMLWQGYKTKARTESMSWGICVCSPNYWCGFLPQKLCQHKVLLRFHMPLRLLLGIVPFFKVYPPFLTCPKYGMNTSIGCASFLRVLLLLPHVDLHSMKYSFVSCDR